MICNLYVVFVSSLFLAILVAVGLKKGLDISVLQGSIDMEIFQIDKHSLVSHLTDFFRIKLFENN